MKQFIINALVLIVIGAVTILVAYMVKTGLDMYYYSHASDHVSDIDRWIYTFWKIYPELKPTSCEILSKGKITWRDRKRFFVEVQRVQSLPKYRQDAISEYNKKQMLLELNCGGE